MGARDEPGTQEWLREELLEPVDDLSRSSLLREFGVVLARVGGITSWLVASVFVGAWGAGTGATVVKIEAEVRPVWGVPGPRGRQWTGVSTVVRAITGAAARVWEACKGV